MSRIRKALIRSRFCAMAGALKRTFGMTGKKKKTSVLATFGIGLLMVYVLVCFIMMFYLLFSKLCEPFHMLEIDWLYFCMAGIMALVLMFVGSIFMTQAQLFEAKDNELLLSMPIRPGDILFSRMIVLYVYNLVFGLLVMLPAGYAYLECAGVQTSMLFSYVIVTLLLPLLSMTLASLFGWLIAVLSSRVRNKSLFTMIFSLAFLGLYLYGYSRINVYIQALILHGEIFAERIKGAALPLYYLGNSMAAGDLRQLLVTVLCLILPFALVYALLSKCFIRITTTKRGFAKAIYKEQRMKVGSGKKALLYKELRHFTASPVYMMNGSLGVIFLLVSVVAILIKREELMQYLGAVGQISDQLVLLMPLALCAMSSTNIITAPSVSLEGKNLWILRSMPVATKDILLTKVKMQLCICLPAVILAAVVWGAVLQVGTLGMVLSVLMSVIANVMFALLGVVVNLKLPKMDWISETAAVKQSASTLVDMFGAMALVLIPGALYLTVLDGMILPELFGIGLTVVYALISVLLYRYLCTRGCRIFEEL